MSKSTKIVLIYKWQKSYLYLQQFDSQKLGVNFTLHKAYDHEGNWEGTFEKGKPCTNENRAERTHVVSI